MTLVIPGNKMIGMSGSQVFLEKRFYSSLVDEDSRAAI